MSRQTMKDFVKSGNYLIDEVKRRAEKGSPHFFDADTMKCFSSRISELAWQQGDNIYFVTSEADRSSYRHSGSIRAFTVRVCDKDGDINTIGYGFQKEPSLNEARKTIKEIMEGVFKIE